MKRSALLLIPLAAAVIVVCLQSPHRNPSPPAGTETAAVTAPVSPEPPRRPQPEEILNMPGLPAAYDQLWKSPPGVAPMAAFQQWADDFSANPSDGKVAEGMKLAQDRREALRGLIQKDPEQALANVVPEAVRRTLPDAVKSLLEEKVDMSGDLIATAAAGDRVPADRRAVSHEARLEDGRTMKAFVYGNREFQPSRASVPIHGIAVDGLLAVGQWPGRVMEKLEAVEAKAKLPEDPACPTSGVKVASTGTEVALLRAKSASFYCGPAHAQSVLADDAAEETIRPPGLGVRTQAPVDAASGGAGQAVPSFLGEGDHAWTTGTKRILVVRVKFEGYSGSYYDFTDLTESNCESIVQGIRDAYYDWSYGRLNVLPVQAGGSKVSPFVYLDDRADEYEGDEIGDIWDEVKDKVEDEYNINPDNYDFILVLAGDAPITDEDDDTKTVWWGGLGRIGEGLSFIRVNNSAWTTQERIDRNVSVSLHEIGHNLGLAHSSNIFTMPQFIDGSVSTGEEYGDRYDRMGRGGIGGDFNVRYKQWLNWLDNSNVPYAVTDGVYTIREHDLEEKSGVRGIQTAAEPVFLPFSGSKQLFIEYRLHYVEPDSNYPYIPYNDTLRAYGAQIRSGLPGSPKAWLLDTTPETANWEPIPSGQTDPDTSGNVDSPLLPGRTFAWVRNGGTVYVTNLNADPESGELQVEIQHGPVAGNDPPAGSITVNTPQGAKDQKILFTASVTDPEDSDLAYHWQIPQFNYDAWHPAVFPNERTITVKFPSTGTWTVKCLVSDKHGGTVALTKSFSVVTNQPPVISAISDRTTDEDVALLNIPFTVSDPTTPAGSLAVSAVSDNTSLLPAGGVVLGGSGGNRTISLTPAANRHGVANITVSVSDGALTDVETFKVTVNAVTPGTPLIASGAVWKFWDQAAAPSGNWKVPVYDETGWGSNNARFVYPAPSLNLLGWTVLSAQAARNVTYYRKSFSMPSSPVGVPTLRFLCDDGLVIYSGGVEIWRHNMPDGPITASTRALSSVSGAKQSEWITVPLNISQFHTGGTNTLAVEVHDAGGTRGGGDVTFDLQLSLLQAPTVSNITDKFSPEDQPAGPYSFSASESESPSGGLTFAGISSNQALVLDSSIKFGINIQTFQWTVTCTPQPNATGTTGITVKVSDGSSETWEKFNLTITPVNDAPVVQPVSDLAVALGELAPLVEVTVSDVDSAAGSLSVTATSSNAAFLPNSGIQVLPGTGPDKRWIRLTPASGVAAQANVTVNVSDGAASGSDVFIFRVSFPLSAASTDVTLVQSGEYWRYWASALPLDGRGNPVDFTDPSLDDRAWPGGRSQLGYGGDGEITPVPVTPYRVTTYFRRKLIVPNASVLSQLKLRMLRDDAAAVYLNGTRVWTSNFPRGAVIAAGTLADTDISGAAEDTWQSLTINTAALVSGSNTLAVEVHQSAMPSAFSPGDLSFDFEMDGVAAAPASPDVLVAPGEMWSYWDQSSYPDATWRLATYVEDGWKRGLARLGYGIGGESTVVNKDNDAGSQRNPSVLFRKVFDIADPAAYTALHLFTQRDDGIAIYLNGVRVHYENVPSTFAAGDLALSEIPAPEHTQWRHYLLDPKKLIAGRNLVAVEIHQASLTGTDLNFDLQLLGELTGLPNLFMRNSGPDMELSWPAAYSGWILRSSSNLGSWSNVAAPMLLDGAWIYVQDSAPGSRRFYQLVKP